MGVLEVGRDLQWAGDRQRLEDSRAGHTHLGKVLKVVVRTQIKSGLTPHI